MIDYTFLRRTLNSTRATEWLDSLPQQIGSIYDPKNHGKSAEWQQLVNESPELPVSIIRLDCDAVTIGSVSDIDEALRNELKTTLLSLSPWRKGPFELFGIDIDTEWRSDWKWRRVIPHIKPLQGRLVLDVGCGNGYYSWRMLGEKAKAVIGIDPLLLNVVQFQYVKKLYGGNAPIEVLPLGLEELPGNLKCFDTVFSMGVLYHRRSPIDHLLNLKECLRPGGELVLETLIIDGGNGETLVPEDRYAMMRNVWFIPSIPTLSGWLKRCGFLDIRVANVSDTTIDEQRSTPWMTFRSLKDNLDPTNPRLTIEGLPAPKRAVLLAQSPTS